MLGQHLPAQIDSYVVYMDIVKSTKENDEDQLHMADHLFRLVRKSLNDQKLPFFHDPNSLTADCYLNTTGDGVVIALADTNRKLPEKIFNMAIDVYRYFGFEYPKFVKKCRLQWGDEIEDEVNKLSGNLMLELPKIRVAIHHGKTQWVRSRVDGRLLVQGKGLNLCARILELARVNHFVVSDEFYYQMTKRHRPDYNLTFRPFTVERASGDLVIYNVYGGDIGNKISPFNPSVVDIKTENSISNLMNIFTIRLKRIISDIVPKEDLSKLKYTVTLLTREKGAEEIDELFPCRKRRNQLGKVVELKSRLIFQSGRGCPGIAWETEKMQYINNLPKVEFEKRKDSGRANGAKSHPKKNNKNTLRFYEYRDIIEKEAGLTESEVRQFAPKYDNHLPQCFISFPLLTDKDEDGKRYKCGVLSCDFSSVLPLGGEQFKALEKRVAEELRYFVALMAELTPDKEELTSSKLAKKRSASRQQKSYLA